MRSPAQDSDLHLDLAFVYEHGEGLHGVHVLRADGGAVGDVEGDGVQWAGKGGAAQRAGGHGGTGVGADVVNGVEFALDVAEGDAAVADLEGAFGAGRELIEGDEGMALGHEGKD